jgi:hypothetical protein
MIETVRLFAMKMKIEERTMTNYERLTDKIMLCRQAAHRCAGREMRDIWVSRAEALEDLRDSMTIEEASKPS